MDLESILLSEISQMKKNWNIDSTYMWDKQKVTNKVSKQDKLSRYKQKNSGYQRVGGVGKKKRVKRIKYGDGRRLGILG